jgi:tetraacyldisaccharide 4'-kinase
MRTPGFWFTAPDRPVLLARLLAPLGALYARATERRLRASPWQAPVPVICVGNLNAGGTGKTPTVIAIAQRLALQGITAHVVSRGHGGSLKGPVRVDPNSHSATETGDEPLLIAAHAPVWVARDRAAGASAAAAAGAQCIILDDGFQNPSVNKDLSLIVVDAGVGFGNGRCIPAGPLREPVPTGLARADLLLSIGPTPDQHRFCAGWGKAIPLPCLQGHLEPGPDRPELHDRRVIAFAGIGRPEKFFATLRQQGAEILRAIPLADHQMLSPELIGKFEAEARAQAAELITTEKDAMRLPAEYRKHILTLPVRLVLQDWKLFDEKISALRQRLPQG